MGHVFDEDLFRMLVEHSQDAVGVIQPDGRIGYISPSISGILGYTPEEFISLDASEAIHPADRAAAAARFSKLIAQPGSSQTAVTRMRHKDGTWRWIETVSTNKLNIPNIGAIIANSRDITDRRQATDAMREAEEKFRFIVESATEFAIFTTDLDGRVNSWNSGASRLLGYDEAEIIGQDCHIFFTRADNAADEPEKEMHDALLTGSGNDEKWHVRKDGSRFWGSGLMMPLRDDTGNVRGYLKIFRDMTREKRAEDAIKDADRRKDEFLAILAHELRNPLAAISNASLLIQMPGEERNLEWGQEVIQRQAKHLGRLLDDLLDVSRITQGKIRLQKERVDLSAIIGRAVETARPLMELKKHRLTLSISPGGLVVFGDPTRIEQVLVNLLTNAIKYTDDGGSISITAESHDEAVVIVEDNGMGILAEMLPRIFELFAQVDRSIDRSQGGLGIGLTLARSLVEMHGGKLWAESEGLGKGSRFWMSLPLAGEQDTPQSRPQREPQRESKKGFRVLVVDDNQDTATGLARLLAASGYEVLTTYDGYSAVALARQEGPSAILLDIGLPGIDGYEVARQLRKDGSCKASLIIAVSGYGQEEDRRRSREAGFDHHFVKPLDYKSLSVLLSGHVPTVPSSEDDQGE